MASTIQASIMHSRQSATDREQRIHNLDQGEALDALVVGGGISGALSYYELCRRGFRTALLDRHDFAGGTSQASGMLIWGGLLYLKNLDFLTVRKFCKARDQLIAEHSNLVNRHRLRYLPSLNSGRSSLLVRLGLYCYWIMGGVDRPLPMQESNYLEKTLLQERRFKDPLTYEEGMLRESDSRFVLGWIQGFDNEDCLPVNYCEVRGGAFDHADHLWRIELKDVATGRELHCRARTVVNCAGVWTDKVNGLLGIQSPCRHVCSKGVFISFPREPDHETSLIVEMGVNNDIQAYMPWGPIAMWGPTETAVDDIESGFRVNVEDIRFLLDQANRNLKRRYGPEDILSIRCGVRPLAVKKGCSKNAYPLELSRRNIIAVDRDRRALAVYGGKLTACLLLANAVADHIQKFATPSRLPDKPRPASSLHAQTGIVDRQRISPDWSCDHEFCLTLDDYLRRRTNISQWRPRRGLGPNNEHMSELHAIAREIADSDRAADQMLADYISNVHVDHDQLLKSV
jgi:glycerol-3-phosphate dehydrogenase